MNIDFAAVLVALTALSGAIWGFDAAFLAPRRRGRLAGHSAALGAIGEAAIDRPPLLVDYAKSFFPIFLIVLLLRSFLIEPFRIPSASMVPTLLEGDFILVNKYAFGIRLPVLNTKVIPIGAPERGDVVVFRPPHEPDKPYIKRVVGLPGDVIGYRNKTVYVNGEPALQADLGTYRGTGRAMLYNGATLKRENLLGVDHEILLRSSAPSKAGAFTVPANHYFMMGDNRDNSSDSREWGVVADENLIGKAFMIWMHWEGGVRFNFSRIGDGVH
jgi:signal peptidase I